jgi:hypothetical protein
MFLLTARHYFFPYSVTSLVAKLRLIEILCLSCLASCSHSLTDPAPLRSAPEEAIKSKPTVGPRVSRAKIRDFNYRKSDMVSLRRDKRSTVGKIIIEDLTMVINDPLLRSDTFEQKFVYYRRPSAEPRPTVLVSTLFSEDVLVDKLAARYFCRKGFNALLVIPSENLSDHDRPLKQSNEVMIRQTIVGRMGIDMLEKFAENDPNRIFAYGVSMGGIRTALLFGVEPRIKRVGVIACGGDIPGIVSDTDYGTLRKIMDARMAAENIPDRIALRAYLDQVITADPLNFAHLKAPEDITLVVSSNDDYIRSEFQQKLRNAFSRPQENRFPSVIYSKVGHISTGVQYIRWVNHFAKFFHAY